MYQLLCQLFFAFTGNNLPEDAFDVIFPLLQGKRKKREDICLGVTDYSKLTPHQILLCDIPLQYYQTWEQFLEFKKMMKKSRFKNRYYLDRDRWQHMRGKPCLPVWQSRNIWIDKTYDKPMVQLNYILYMDSEEDKRAVLKNINKNREFRGVDISWMSCCVFCGDFMRLRSYNFKGQKSSLEDACNRINRCGIDYDRLGNNVRLKGCNSVPICELCRESKDRQGEFRMNMLARGDWGETMYHRREEEYHRDLADMYPKPDLNQVPSELVSKWSTPLEAGATFSYWDLTDPLSDYFWHPDLTADEYMRWMEYTKWSHINDDEDPLDDELWDQFEEDADMVIEDMIEGIITVLEEE